MESLYIILKKRGFCEEKWRIGIKRRGTQVESLTEEEEWLLNYAYDQVYIATADINQVDIVYKARIPNHLRPDINYQFTSDSHMLHPASKLTQFSLFHSYNELHLRSP